MTVKKLFISHSSKTPPDLARLRAVCTRLKQLGYYLLVDKNAEFGNKEAEIYPGSDWDLRINEWMAECHAAVILFNNTAFSDSDWVKKEAAVLSWRRELEDDFTLIPVLLDGIKAKDLQQGLYGVLRISKSQCILGANDPALLAQTINDSLGPPGSQIQTPFEHLVRILRRILQEQADADTLEEAWQTLTGTGKPPWQRDQQERFADALVRLLLREPTHILEQLRKLINTIRPKIERDRAYELLQTLACLWVDERAAAGLAGARYITHCVALNGYLLDDFTAARYVERAWPLNISQLVCIDQQAFRTPDGTQKAIRDQFRPKGVPDTEAINKMLDQRIAGIDEPVVVLVVLTRDDSEQPQFPDADLLDKTSESYPNLIFLFGTGPSAPHWLPENIRLLDPPLDITVEFNMKYALDETEKFLAKFYKTQGASG